MSDGGRRRETTAGGDVGGSQTIDEGRAAGIGG